MITTSKSDGPLPSWLHFVELGFPSANLVLASDDTRVVFDGGFGSDVARIDAALRERGVSPSDLDVVVNSHWHSDHVGANAWFQLDHGIPIAASRADAEAVNAVARDACLAEWLDQPVEQYRVDRVLESGEEFLAGPATWLVVPSPGHTPTHLSFFQPDEGVLVLGDAVHDGDVGWVNVALEGPGAIDVALASVERLANLDARVALPGHGPLIIDPPAAFAAAHARYEKMRSDPERAGWHACKRVFAFALMIHDGLDLDGLSAFLATRPWLVDHATNVFHVEVEDFVRDLITEMDRSGATEEREGRLYCSTPSYAPASGWLQRPGVPRDWVAET